MTETAFPGLTTVEDLFRDLVWGRLVEAALGLLFASAPWMAWGPIGIVVGFVVKHFAGKLFEALRLAVDLKAIVLVNEQHRKEFDRAAVVLQIIAREKGADSPEFREAKENAKQSLARFVRFNG